MDETIDTPPEGGEDVARATPEALVERGFIRACSAQEVPVVMPNRVSLGGKSLLVCRGDQGRFSVVDELCPHKLESMAFGVVHGNKLICPHHQYSFDLETGKPSVRRCAALEVYPTELSSTNDVYVLLPNLPGDTSPG